MTKQELADYLVNLVSIMESKEDAGRPRGMTLGREYEKHYEMLLDQIKKEMEDEARQSEQQRDGGEEGAELQGGEPGRGGSARDQGGNG